jgi:hypothetical protein
MKFEKGKRYDLELRIFRRDVQVVSESENSIKVCSNYRMQGDPDWTPVYHHISKKNIVNVIALKK